MKIVIDIGNFTDVSRVWFEQMINKEILETTGALQNDILWSKGTEDEAVQKLHLENQHNFSDYLDVLKDIQGQMHDEPKKEEKENSKEAKADSGKPKLSLVPIQGMWNAVARIREYGCQKYKDPDNWKTVEIERYYDAFYRHVSAMLEDPNALDKESGLPHKWHAACNLCFILEMEKANDNIGNK